MKSKITPDPRLVEALPWMLFFRDGKSLGEIARMCDGSIYDYTYLGRACTRIVEDNFKSLKKTPKP